MIFTSLDEIAIENPTTGEALASWPVSEQRAAN